jgi:ribonuclease-3
VSDNDDRLSRAEELLGHRFADRSLLELALTHPSAVPEVRGAVSNERLEFLGDSVLGFVVAEHLYRRLPDVPEGTLTRRKVAVVNGVLLASVADDLGLGALISYGRGERESTRGRASALENTLEAAIGAVYLDAGLEAAAAAIRRLFGSLLDRADLTPPLDSKSALQQLTQSRELGHPTYAVVSSQGPIHAPAFTVAVSVAGELIATAEGHSKQSAEKEAARLALVALRGADDA